MVLNQQKRVRVKLRSLEEFARGAAALLRLRADSVTICLVADARIAEWNRLYRVKNRPTDVLSFPVAAPARNGNGRMRRLRNAPSSGGEKDYLGDIAIAPAVARRNALAAGRSFEQEMKILTLHGLLHLMGYDHETDNGEMERFEARLRRKLGIA
jgi:probable rRNA maturation factor